jgi:hypothetical protein
LKKQSIRIASVRTLTLYHYSLRTFIATLTQEEGIGYTYPAHSATSQRRTRVQDDENCLEKHIQSLTVRITRFRGFPISFEIEEFELPETGESGGILLWERLHSDTRC